MKAIWCIEPATAARVAVVDGVKLRVWRSGLFWLAAVSGSVVGRCATERDAKRMASQVARGIVGAYASVQA